MDSTNTLWSDWFALGANNAQTMARSTILRHTIFITKYLLGYLKTGLRVNLFNSTLIHELTGTWSFVATSRNTSCVSASVGHQRWHRVHEEPSFDADEFEVDGAADGDGQQVAVEAQQHHREDLAHRLGQDLDFRPTCTEAVSIKKFPLPASSMICSPRE